MEEGVGSRKCSGFSRPVLPLFVRTFDSPCAPPTTTASLTSPTEGPCPNYFSTESLLNNTTNTFPSPLHLLSFIIIILLLHLLNITLYLFVFF